MSRGRPRKPTAVLEAIGAFVKDPQRRAGRLNEPAPNGPIGDPPTHFDDFHREVWFEVLDESHKGVATKADRKLLELIVCLTVKLRVNSTFIPKWLRLLGNICREYGIPNEDIEAMQRALHSVTGISSQEAALLGNLLTRMGMTPADRSKVQVEPDKPAEDHIDQLLRALGGNTSGESVQ